MNRLYMPQEIGDKHNINLTNIWERVKGEPREEYLCFDVDCSM